MVGDPPISHLIEFAMVPLGQEFRITADGAKRLLQIVGCECGEFFELGVRALKLGSVPRQRLLGRLLPCDVSNLRDEVTRIAAGRPHEQRRQETPHDMSVLVNVPFFAVVAARLASEYGQPQRLVNSMIIRMRELRISPLEKFSLAGNPIGVPACAGCQGFLPLLSPAAFPRGFTRCPVEPEAVFP
jgi:hypothetical protein